MTPGAARHRLFAAVVVAVVATGSTLDQEAPRPPLAWQSGCLAIDAGLETHAVRYSISGTW